LSAPSHLAGRDFACGPRRKPQASPSRLASFFSSLSLAEKASNEMGPRRLFRHARASSRASTSLRR
jgi:hypothetical protein